MLWSCINYAFNLILMIWASVCMWICRGLNSCCSVRLSPFSVPFQLDTVPSCSCSDHYWPGIQDDSTLGGLWLSVKPILVLPRVYSSMCITIKSHYFKLHVFMIHLRSTSLYSAVTWPLQCHSICCWYFNQAVQLSRSLDRCCVVQ